MVRLARETSDLRRWRRSLCCDPRWEDAQSADISAESPLIVQCTKARRPQQATRVSRLTDCTPRNEHDLRAWATNA